MSLSLLTRTARYQCDGVTTAFVVNFLFNKDADLRVTLLERSSGAAAKLPALTTDYTLSGAGEAAGGVLTFNAVTDLSADRDVLIERFTPGRQEKALADLQSFPGRRTEAMGDDLALAVQDAQGQAAQAVKAPAGESGMILPTIADRATYPLAFDATGSPVPGTQPQSTIDSVVAAQLDAAAGLNCAPVFKTYADLRAATSITAATVNIHAGLAGGFFDKDAAAIQAVDDGVTTILDGDGMAWRRRYDSLASPRWYRAIGDGKKAFDGTTTASSTTFTSAGATFTSADVGKLITVDGAGAAGAELSTTIAGFTDATTVTLAVAAGTTVSGADWIYGTDNQAALQAALDAGKTLRLKRGLYCISDELIIGMTQRGAGLLGESHPSEYFYSTQTGGPTWDGSREPIIVYCGQPTSFASPKSVLRTSTAATGVQPAQTFDGVVWAGPLDQVGFDANKRAYVGVYYARVSGVNIGQIYCRAALGHGFFLSHCFSGTVKHVYAWGNEGCGITIGKADLSDAWGVYQVNAMKFGYLEAANNGADGQFNETTNPKWGYGVGFFAHRGNEVEQILAEINDGPGIFYGPTSGPNKIGTTYTELNSTIDRYQKGAGTDAVTEGRTARAYSVWFEGFTGGASMHAQIENAFCSSEAIKITGTEPSRFPAGAFTIKEATNGVGIFADWNNYRLEKVDVGLADAITGNLPAANDENSNRQTTPVTTLYVRSGGSDSNDGRTSSTAFLTFQKAIDMARIVTDVTTIDCTGTTLTNQVIDLSGLRRNISVTGGTFNQVASGNYALNVSGGRGACVLTFASAAQLQTMRVQNATVAFTGLTTHNTINTPASAVYLMWLDHNAEVLMNAGVVADANGARGVRLQGGSRLSTSSSWRIDNTTLATNLGIVALSGGGIVTVNYGYSSSNAAWAKNVLTGGGATGHVEFTDERLSFSNGNVTPYSSGTTGAAAAAAGSIAIQVKGVTYNVLYK